MDTSKAEADRLEAEAAQLEEQLAAMREARNRVWNDVPAWQGANVQDDEADAQDEESQNNEVGDDVQLQERNDAKWLKRLEAMERRAEKEAAQQAEFDADDEARVQAGCSEKEWRERKQKAKKFARQATKKQAWEWQGVQSFLEDCGLARHGYAELLQDHGITTPEALIALDPAGMKRLGMDNKHDMKLRMGIAELRTFGVCSAGAPPTIADECPASLMVAGAEATRQWDLMGTFSKLSSQPTEHQDGRPIYKNTNGHFLYYWKADEQWQIGTTYTDSDCATYAHSSATCPIGVSEWYIWDGNDWSSAYPFTIKESRAMVAPSMHAPSVGRAVGSSAGRPAPRSSSVSVAAAAGTGAARRHHSIANDRQPSVQRRPASGSRPASEGRRTPTTGRSGASSSMAVVPRPPGPRPRPTPPPPVSSSASAAAMGVRTPPLSVQASNRRPSPARPANIPKPGLGICTGVPCRAR